MSVRTGREDGPRCGRHGLHPPQENATPRPPFIELLFAIPSAPDLGAPAGRRHGFRVLSDVNLWNALPPSDRGRPAVARRLGVLGNAELLGFESQHDQQQREAKRDEDAQLVFHPGGSAG